MNTIKMLFLVVFILSIGACLSWSVERKNWDFIQSVGGIDVTEPYLEAGIWQLPVRCDVSGLSEITVKPTVLNSALACAEVESRIEGRSVYLTVVTALIDKGRNSPICERTALGKALSGEYHVFYEGPDSEVGDLGKIKIMP